MSFGPVDGQFLIFKCHKGVIGKIISILFEWKKSTMIFKNFL